jgi:peptidoglycan DL-endopeptidase CwlO
LSTLSAVARPRRLRHLLRALVVAVFAGSLIVTGISPAAAAPRSTPTLSYGDQNSAVVWVQKRLHIQPHSGYFGPRTQSAVKSFQHRHHLPRTGVVGKRTWKAFGVRVLARKLSARPAHKSHSSSTSRDAKVLRIAAAQKGKPYRYGATGPRAFDCSGFVGYVYRKAGVKLPRTSSAIRQRAHRISAAQVRPGDLVFVQRHGHVSHVAIYAGHNMWWEASNSSHPVGKNRAWTRSVSYGRV